MSHPQTPSGRARSFAELDHTAPRRSPHTSPVTSSCLVATFVKRGPPRLASLVTARRPRVSTFVKTRHPFRSILLNPRHFPRPPSPCFIILCSTIFLRLHALLDACTTPRARPQTIFQSRAVFFDRLHGFFKLCVAFPEPREALLTLCACFATLCITRIECRVTIFDCRACRDACRV
jgi:hypothetical protein